MVHHAAQNGQQRLRAPLRQHPPSLNGKAQQLLCARQPSDVVIPRRSDCLAWSAPSGLLRGLHACEAQCKNALYLLQALVRRALCDFSSRGCPELLRLQELEREVVQPLLTRTQTSVRLTNTR